MSKLKKKRDSPESQAFWSYIEKTAKEVYSWPDWKKGSRCGTSQLNLEEDKHAIKNQPGS